MKDTLAETRFLQGLKKIIENVLSIEDIKINSRKLNLVIARHLFFYIARKEGIKFHTLGAFLDRDHSTAIHSVRVAEDLIKYSKIHKETFLTILAILNHKKQEESVIHERVKRIIEFYKYSGNYILLTNDLRKLFEEERKEKFFKEMLKI